MARIKKHVINPVESREADLGEKDTLRQQYATPDTVETLHGFTAMNAEEVDAFVKKYGLAMDDDDLAFCRDYFASEHRDPTLTEIRMIDTYWSDHCRHTTFLTTIDGAEILEAPRWRRRFNGTWRPARPCTGTGKSPSTSWTWLPWAARR